MAGSRAALRVGLIGGIVLGLAVAAQQVTNSPDLQLLGFLIMLSGLTITGLLAAREAGDYTRWASVRAGTVGGLIAGLLASLAVIAVLLVLSVTGENLQRIDDAIRQLYTPAQLQELSQMGVTVDAISQASVVLQIMCCGAGLPILGVLLGAVGGALAPGIYRGRAKDQADRE